MNFLKEILLPKITFQSSSEFKLWEIELNKRKQIFFQSSSEFKIKKLKRAVLDPDPTFNPLLSLRMMKKAIIGFL